MAEKASAIRPPLPASSVALRLTWTTKMLFLVSLFGFLFFWQSILPMLDLDDLPLIQDVLSFGRYQASGQCPQVAPLKPKLKSEELLKMDEYLKSEVFRNASIGRLSGAIQIPSMSYDDLGPVGKDERWDIFFDLAKYLEDSYPLVHQTFQLDKVNTHGLAYTWLGSDISLKPLLLMAHQDVVPVPEDTVKSWTHPPFSGYYDGKLIWGRGASDCKNSLTGILEALEQLIAAKFTPTRSIVLSFGFDEESSGHNGAGKLSEFLLQKHGKNSFAAIVDEGAGSYTMWGKTFALPGVAEKVWFNVCLAGIANDRRQGYLDATIVVRMPGGHSSIPPDHNGIGVMSELITLIESNLYEPQLHDDNPYLGLLQCGAAHGTKFPTKLKKLLSRRAAQTCSKKEDKLAVEASKESLGIRYLMTTSVAADVIRGGVKVNALPERTEVTVNHRINVGEHNLIVKDKLTHLAKHVAAKFNLTVNAFNGKGEAPSSITLKARANDFEPAPITPTTIDPITPYAIISGTTRALYGEDIVMSPGIMTGNTDTRFYWDLTRHIFRYAPGFDPEFEGVGNIHTVDEAISVKAHLALIQWYSLFIRLVGTCFSQKKNLSLMEAHNVSGHSALTTSSLICS
jgi:Gly-Xaa carboxypeptidase